MSDAPPERVHHADAWVIEFEESQRPTLIRTTQGLDLPARGRFCRADQYPRNA
jgi:hypothetical protein